MPQPPFLAYHETNFRVYQVPHKIKNKTSSSLFLYIDVCTFFFEKTFAHRLTSPLRFRHNNTNVGFRAWVLWAFAT